VWVIKPSIYNIPFKYSHYNGQCPLLDLPVLMFAPLLLILKVNTLLHDQLTLSMYGFKMTHLWLTTVDDGMKDLHPAWDGVLVE